MARYEELGFESEEEMEEYEAEQEEHADEIRNAVLDYVEENDVPESTAVFTLLQLAVSMHMSGYLGATEKPSAQGLKMELDRFAGDFADMVREAKKGAAEFIEDFKAASEAEQE
ncbi:hypothetical protein [Prosthecomicrobium sp. N25]|uniref:hypothetical protein n=1 Tax=Prosthecomicrobium sp. N25 TaxID=3129254 RepID=UPI0030770F4E